jgi:uncharacterized protein YbgA (DUF1722 family)/uncharacterized protein YbbK (DUF523 family)
MSKDRIRLGVSTCLLGERVRYDGGHKRSRFLTDVLADYVEFVPVCPEVECGFPIPRESFRLFGDPESPRFITSRTKQDFTERMTKWARKRVVELEKENLCGFVLKSDSPSSGMQRIRVYNEKGGVVRTGVGMFARQLLSHFPLMPIEEDGRLNDDGIRENFIERIFAYKRWQDLLASSKSRGGLVRFQTEHKLLILSHSRRHSDEMGRLVAHAKEIPPSELYRQYESLLLEALKVRATVRKHCNVLQHILGYFKKVLTADEKQEVLEIIEQYRKELVPLIVPITLLNHFVRKYDQPYLKQQCYLHPHPSELKLRNHV